MAGINNLREVYEKKGKDFLDGLLNNYVIINEKVEGTFFGVKKDQNDSFRYFKKSGEISYVDRMLMQYYNAAISYFEAMPLEKRQRIPSNFYFGFEYFTRSDSNKSKYDRLPKNGLVLSYIHKLDENNNVLNTVQNKEQLDKWADYLGVERPPIIFQGLLTDEQKTAILEFIYEPSEQLMDKFKTKSFTKYIISVLNDKMPASFLKNNLEGNIESIIFRFYDQSLASPEGKVFLAKIVDPIFQQTQVEKAPKENRSQDYIWLIVIDLMNHFEIYDTSDLKKMTDIDGSFDEKYVNLINTVFKDFIKEYSSKYDGLMLEVPEYLKRPEFELDLSLIKDKEVLKLIKGNETYKEIYKILLNFFRRVRKKSTASFFNPGMLTQLNIIVNKIKNIIMGDEIYESLFPSFSDFIGSQYGELILSEKEAAAIMHQKKDPIEVNLLIGSFQPINMGHIKAAQKLHEKNGKPVVLVAIKPNTQTQRSPFSLKQTQMMLEKVKQEYASLIEEVRVVPQGQIEDIIKVIQPTYKPLLWGTSESRLKDYALQLDYIKKRNIPLRTSNELKLVELPMFLKSDELMAAIKKSDFKEFKRLVPSSIISEFFNLQKELETSVTESVSTTSLGSLFEKGAIQAEIINPKLKEDDGAAYGKQ